MRRRSAGLVVAGLVMGLVGGAAASAGAVTTAVELWPGAEFTAVPAFTDDSVVALAVDAAGDVALVSRSLVTSADDVTVGPAQVLARAAGWSFAEDAGTVAYLREVDERVALRAPDGTVSVPAWGDLTGVTTAGPTHLTPQWLGAGEVLVDRDSGIQYDVASAVTDLPEGMTLDFSWIEGLTDTAALVSIDASDAQGALYSGVYAVELSPAGPGVPQLLDAGDPVTEELHAVGIVEGRFIWTATTWQDETPTGTVVASVPVADPGEAPMTAEVGPEFLTAVGSGSELLVVTDGGTEVRLTWVDPLEPSMSLESATLPVGTLPLATRGGLVVYDTAVTTELVDAAGRMLGADQTEIDWPLTFVDVPPGATFRGQVHWLADEGVTTGTVTPTGTYFKPAAPVSREAMAAFLYRFAGEPGFTPPATSPFVDVATSHPFYPAIAWLAEQGITTGTVTPTGTYFKPAAPVSREAMAAFLYRFADEPAFTPPATSPFVDVATSHLFYPAIAWLADEGISTGTVTATGTYFKPGASVSRAAMAAFLFRYDAAGLRLPWIG